MSESRRRAVGTVGLYDDADTLVRAAQRVRDAGFKEWDCHTPYPVHGLDRAMGLGPSPVAYVTIGVGLAGLAVAILMQGWTSMIAYPIHIGGKPLWSGPAFVPIMFELFVLFAASSTLVAVVVFCRLGRWHSPLHDSGVMAEVTSRRFALVLAAADPHYSEAQARSLLEASGCTDIRPLVEIEETER